MVVGAEERVALLAGDFGEALEVGQRSRLATKRDQGKMGSEFHGASLLPCIADNTLKSGAQRPQMGVSSLGGR